MVRYWGQGEYSTLFYIAKLHPKVQTQRRQNLVQIADWTTDQITDFVDIIQTLVPFYLSFLLYTVNGSFLNLWCTSTRENPSLSFTSNQKKTLVVY